MEVKAGETAGKAGEAGGEGGEAGSEAGEVEGERCSWEVEGLEARLEAGWR